MDQLGGSTKLIQYSDLINENFEKPYGAYLTSLELQRKFDECVFSKVHKLQAILL